ncbi:helix-turn-helix domain-containing protein [Microbacterium sp. Leaf288]|uniref:helix-turn-helix domain-containing protein n=1 Tax=Microbacterium sp. Leaf288 TaxID=1736323 RepID=UPI0009EA1234|nr:helix-turn-helix domain-containing protein [Microbacterium sp. Leaf288]
MENGTQTSLRTRCLELIDAHFSEHRADHAWLARRLHVSRRHLARAFEGDRSVAERLAHRRLAQFVVTAVLEPEAPLSTIAERCGYASYETMRTQSHRYLACSPRNARDLIATGESGELYRAA